MLFRGTASGSSARCPTSKLCVGRSGAQLPRMDRRSRALDGPSATGVRQRATGNLVIQDGAALSIRGRQRTKLDHAFFVACIHAKLAGRCCGRFARAAGAAACAGFCALFVDGDIRSGNRGAQPEWEGDHRRSNRFRRPRRRRPHSREHCTGGQRAIGGPWRSVACISWFRTRGFELCTAFFARTFFAYEVGTRYARSILAACSVQAVGTSGAVLARYTFRPDWTRLASSALVASGTSELLLHTRLNLTQPRDHVTHPLTMVL